MAPWGRPLSEMFPEAEPSVTWTDTSGNLWLFGGYGPISTGYIGDLNDFWKFSPSTLEWTWMGGSNTIPTSTARARNVWHTGHARCAKYSWGSIPGGELDRQQWQFLALWRAMASTHRATWAFSTIFGSSILPRTNGHGRAAAARSEAVPPALCTPVPGLGCTARWVFLLQRTLPAAGMVPSVGLTATGNCGFSAGPAQGRVRMCSFSTIFGSSTLPYSSGHG